MATLPTIKRILAEKFPDVKWISQLLDPLNSFMESVGTALNRQLTVDQNMAGAFLTATVDGSYPLKLAWSLKTRPTWVVVGSISRVDGQDFAVTSAVQVQWRFINSDLQIDGVTGGLTVGGVSKPPAAADKYRLNLLCLTG